MLSSRKKDELDDILNRNRRRLSKIRFKQLSSVSNTINFKNSKTDIINQNIKIKQIKNKQNIEIVPTIFKSIAWRKSYDSLGILMQYILKNTEVLENNLGEVVGKEYTQIKAEFERFNLLQDKDNLIKYSRNTKENNLKHRQIGHFVFSLPNNKLVNKELLQKVLVEKLPELFTGYKYCFGIHSNTQNMHAHIALKTKNDLTGKQIRLGGKELLQINKILYAACLENTLDLGLNLSKANEKIIPKITKIKKLPDFLLKTLPNWVKMYENNEFGYISTNENTLKLLDKLEMSKENITKFLHMYNEDKNKAIWCLNNMSNLFNVTKKTIRDYKKNNDNKGFTLRKVQIETKKTNIDMDKWKKER